MRQVEVEEIGRNLHAYLQHVERGETVVILRDGKPVAEIKPAPKNGQNLRPYGLCNGDFSVPDDFDAPLPKEVLKHFEGE